MGRKATEWMAVEAGYPARPHWSGPALAAFVVMVVVAAVAAVVMGTVG